MARRTAMRQQGKSRKNVKAIEGAGAVRAFSGRHIKSSEHVLRDGCFCHGARRSTWRSQMDLKRQNRGGG